MSQQTIQDQVTQYFNSVINGTPSHVAFQQAFPNGLPSQTDLNKQRAAANQTSAYGAIGGTLLGALGTSALYHGIAGTPGPFSGLSNLFGGGGTTANTTTPTTTAGVTNSDVAPSFYANPTSDAAQYTGSDVPLVGTEDATDAGATDLASSSAADAGTSDLAVSGADAAGTDAGLAGGADAAGVGFGSLGIGAALPVAGIAAGTYLLGNGLYNAVNGNKDNSGTGLASRAQADFSTMGAAELLPLLGLGHKTTVQDEADVWNALQKNNVTGAAQAAQDNLNSRAQPNYGQKYANFSDAVQHVATDDPANFREVAGNYQTFGNDWANYSSDQQNKIMSALAQAGLYKSNQGSVIITDPTQAKQIAAQVLGQQGSAPLGSQLTQAVG